VNSCDKCLAAFPEDNTILSDIAFSKKSSIENLKQRLERKAKEREQDETKQKFNQHGDNNLCPVHDAKRHFEKKERHWPRKNDGLNEIRPQQATPSTNERGTHGQKKLDQSRKNLNWHPQNTIGQDIENGIEQQFELGNIELINGKVKITPRGAKKLAKKALQKTIGQSIQNEIGPHYIEKKGYGANLSITSRKYEVGDEYYRIDFEKTFLKTMERHHPNNNMDRHFSLRPEDFQIHDEMHQNRIISGLLIDESGSMLGDKIRLHPVMADKMGAAIETALALSELIRQHPNDLLKVYLFSHVVREIPYNAILNTSFSYGAYTDIKRALQNFRRAVSGKKGAKQAYLITDAEPNSENGNHLGFKKACAGVIQEALNYRTAGITLNIVMLDQNPQLKDFASSLARKNLGRVLFSSPENLQKTVVQNFLKARKAHNKM